MPNQDKDNWEHRSENMRCKTCMFYVPKGGGKLGRCRQSSPTLKGFPAVFPNDWCGDHKLDEEKVEEDIDKKCNVVECNLEKKEGANFCDKHYEELR